MHFLLLLLLRHNLSVLFCFATTCTTLIRWKLRFNEDPVGLHPLSSFLSTREKCLLKIHVINIFQILFFSLFSSLPSLMMFYTVRNPFPPNERRTKKILQVILAFSILVLCYIPSSNLLFRTGFVIAERTLYLPSIGSSLLIGLGLKNLEKRLKRWLNQSHQTESFFSSLLLSIPKILASLVIVVFALKTYERCKDW